MRNMMNKSSRELSSSDPKYNPVKSSGSVTELVEEWVPVKG